MKSKIISKSIFSKRDNREYAQKISQANHEVLYAVRPGISEGVIPNNGVLLHVELYGKGIGCCGGSADYKAKEDIPYHSVPCPCGNPDHWLIKYEDPYERKDS